MSDTVPIQTSVSWRVQKPGAQPKTIEPLTFVRRWSLLDNSKVCPPHEVDFVEPLLAPKIGDQIFQRWRVKNFIAIIGISFMAFGSLIHIINNGLDKTNGRIFTLFVLGVFLLSAWYWTSSSRALLASQSRFLSTTYHDFLKKNFVCILLLGASLILHYRGWDDDSLQSTWWAYGTVLDKVNSGAYWRVLVGPLVHGSTAHLASNYLMMVLLFPVAYVAISNAAILAIIAGATLSYVSYVLLVNMGFITGADVILGISGGTYSLLGVIFVSAIYRPQVFPARFFIYILAYCIFAFFSTELLAEKVSTVAHVAGFIVGATTGAIYLKLLESRRALEK